MLSKATLTLGLSQTIAWASSYYLPAVLAAPIARDLGTSTSTVYAGFSWALLVAAPLAPVSGKLIDRFGGRAVLMITSLLFAMGMVALASVSSMLSLFLAWTVMGIAMGCGLYDAAFAALVYHQGQNARKAIAGITLIGGFASTIGWPLSAWMEFQWGWRQACLGWAAIHLLLGLPLNAMFSKPGKAAVASPEALEAGTSPEDKKSVSLGTTVLLSAVFATSYFSSVAMAAHLPALLQAVGVTLVASVAAGALIGPAQVAGRLLEIWVMKNRNPIWSARMAAFGHPLGVMTLLSMGPGVAPAFALLHGLGNGVMTIVRGTLPLAYFGVHGYGEKQGWLVIPTRVVSALAPYAVGLALDAWGAATWWLTLGLSTTALLALFWLRAPRSAG
ncbi:MAG: hypothetical protein RI949_993 [Pseudomonadota bacterium]|jgi:MFS family permease